MTDVKSKKYLYIGIAVLIVLVIISIIIYYKYIRKKEEVIKETKEDEDTIRDNRIMMQLSDLNVKLGTIENKINKLLEKPDTCSIRDRPMKIEST